MALILGIKHYSLKVFHLYKRQNKSVRWIIASILFILSLWILSGIILSSRTKNVTEQKKQFIYKTTRSISKLKQSVLNVSGVAESKRKVQLFSEVSGIIEEINAQPGQFLKKGEVIVTIEAKNKKELYEKAKIKLNQSKIEFRSANMLYQRKLLSEADLVKAKANLSSAEADLKQAELDYLNTKIITPFDGYVNEILVNQGDYVSNMMNNKPIGIFIAAEPMIVKVEVADANINSIKPGLKAVMTTLNGLEVNGMVSAVSKVINNNTSSFPIEISFANEDFKILHGQALLVKIFLGEKQAHKLPQSILVLNDKGELGIKCLDERNIVRFYKVTLIDEEPGYVWLSDLPSKLQVISLGQIYLTPGEKLEFNEGNISEFSEDN